MKKSSLLFISIASLSIFILACKSTKTISSNAAPTVRSKEEVLKALEKRNLDFTWFSAKATGDFESPQFGGSGSMQLRIKKDSLIWMVGKKFSIEGFRTIINRDSFYVVNRLERFYAEEPLDEIHKMFGMKVAFEDMQQLLAGNVFLPDTSQVYNYVQTNSYCRINANIDIYDVTYVINAFDLHLMELEIKDQTGRKIVAMFEEYKKLKNTKVPYLRKYSFYDETRRIAKLDVEVNEIEIDIPKTMIFSIPSHYERVRF
jgi:hypothetical protein